YCGCRFTGKTDSEYDPIWHWIRVPVGVGLGLLVGGIGGQILGLVVWLIWSIPVWKTTYITMASAALLFGFLTWRYET
ncbi:MAG TPA: hypothetical protein VGM36_04275, partial [Rhizomicrobium sp.]